MRYVKNIGRTTATATVVLADQPDLTGRVAISVEVEIPAVIAYGQMCFLASPDKPLIGVMAAGSLKAAQRIAAMIQVGPY